MKCTSCGAEITGKYCEYCGSEAPKENIIVNVTNNYYNNAPIQDDSTSTPNRKTKKRIWLWILGWLFIFPLPLTILLLKKKSVRPVIKYSVIIVEWLLYFVIFAPEKQKPDSIDVEVTSEASTEEIVLDATVTEKIKTEEPEKPKDANIVFANDEVVNRFITEFNAVSSFKITEISQGNIRTKYFGYANDRYLEMINANDAAVEAFSLTINGGQKDADKEAIYEVFRDAIKVLDPSITDDMIDMVLQEFENKNTSQEIGTCSVKYYPAVELSHGFTSCRIEISANNYK